MTRRIARHVEAACLGVAMLTSSTLLATADDLDQVMHLLSLRRHGEVSFIEQHFFKLLKRPVESSGELIYDAPNRLEKRTLEPRLEDLVLVDQVLTIERDHRARVLDLKTYPQIAPFIEAIRATLAGDRAALERMFRVDFSGSAARWNLRLTPLDPRVVQSVAGVQIDGGEDTLFRVEIRQTDGDRSLLTLREHAAR